ncbi:MAG: radical SAM family heme chaperone HemW [Peptostreptococcaceae bacterium]
MLGLYIHIPFCESKCFYCDFNSYKMKSENEKKIYIDNLIKEMDFYKEEFNKKEFTSIFLGGGTPSILDKEEIKIIFDEIYKRFKIKGNAEITIECNPETLNKEKLILFKECGVNRLSIGLQSTQNKNLEYIGRVHTYETFEEHYFEAREVGFENINIDLMYSLPNQTFEEFKESLEKIISLNPSHISAYSLILEENTRMFKMYENEEFELNEDELDIKIYNHTIKTLSENGYNHYEISNYAKEGYECMHNINYWKCDNYLGLGAGASGYIGNLRYKNIEKINDYNKLIESLEKPILESEVLSFEDEIEENIIMNLRMNKGINIVSFNEKFDIDFVKRYDEVLEKLKNENLIMEKNNHIFFTQKGREISNTVLLEFLK